MLPFPHKGLQGLLGPNPVHTMGIGQGTSWMSCQLIAGPLLMAVAATQGAICTSGLFVINHHCLRFINLWQGWKDPET